MPNLFAPPIPPAPSLEDVLRKQWADRVNRFVAARFDGLAANVTLTPKQHQDAATKVQGITRVLNRVYWGIDSTTDNCIVEGSWGKGTQTRPPRDIDMMFVLPSSEYHRFEQRVGNKQSALLQDVKETLLDDYADTDMRGDGQVVDVRFTNAHGVEVVPAFLLQNGRYWICDTNNGGRYKEVDPVAEIAAIETSDRAYGGATRDLIRMVKRWQWFCNVDELRSFQLELVIIDFLPTVHYGVSGYRSLYDWLVRDFFRYLITRANGWVFVPGTLTPVALGDDWLTKAQTALGRARKASEFAEREMPISAVAEWQKIFGTDIS
jgi:hypothetical protein